MVAGGLNRRCGAMPTHLTNVTHTAHAQSTGTGSASGSNTCIRDCRRPCTLKPAPRLHPPPPSTRPASPPVCVGLYVVGHVVVDHQRHIRDVDAAPRNVGGNEHIELAVLEPLDAHLWGGTHTTPAHKKNKSWSAQGPDTVSKVPPVTIADALLPPKHWWPRSTPGD